MVYQHDHLLDFEAAKSLTTQQAHLNQNATYEILKYKDYNYLCEIPLFEDINFAEIDDSTSLYDSTNITASSPRNEKNEIVNKIMNINKELAEKKICLIHFSDYWAYQFCFHNDFVQFHYLRNGPQKDPNSPLYRLGRFPKTPQDSDFEVVLSDLGDNGASSYISQHLADGSICDLTGKPRSTFVKYKCGTGLSVPKIESVLEMKSCQYQITIALDDLCEIDAFQSKEQAVHNISCQLIATYHSVPERIHLQDYTLKPLGFNTYIGKSNNETLLDVMVTNKLDVTEKKELRSSLLKAFLDHVASNRFVIPQYALDFLKEQETTGSQQSTGEKRTLSNDDRFVYITKLYNMNGEFLDNLEFSGSAREGISLKFGSEDFALQGSGSVPSPSNRWYGLSVEEGETPVDNLIMVNGFRFKFANDQTSQ